NLLGKGANGFFGQEVLRFQSIAGTLIENFTLDNTTASVDERYITHILARSVLENFFWLFYIFEDPTQKDARYEQLINSFKKDYLKLWNEKILPHKNQLEPADPSWSTLNAPKFIDILRKIRNDHGDRLDDLYFIYRVGSFDTHGKNMDNIFQTVFNKNCNFSVLDLRKCFDYVANHYLFILQDLKANCEI
ncbi:MAG: hypothetical protein HGA69_00830, partial [Desulfobulbaceae bacterium]|nr:hypothetical protein [Desulfobulbaceae bacterium]